jgi:hypothetical protein
LKTPWARWIGGVGKEVEGLLSKSEALNLSPSPTEKEKKIVFVR